MRFLAYLLTLFLVGTAVAQNPTILQGNYITNVFGNSNFVLNPNAQTNVLNVTVSNATVTRSTTTPLVATSEFNITTSTSTGYADWSTRTFDAGMKGQNCEARFTYRGFSVGSTTAQILQGANVVAQLTLTASTDPRIASINFPCGDLSSATTFRLQQATASLTGTNEIGGIYVGLATNMANVAQAEAVVSAQRTTAQTITSGSAQKLDYATESLDVYGEYTSGVYTAKRAGVYYVEASVLFTSAAWTSANVVELFVVKNGSGICSGRTTVMANVTINNGTRVGCQLNVSAGDTIQINVYQDRGSNTDVYGTGDATYSRLQIYRFPSSSELVVKPETQNVFGSIDGNGVDSTTTSGSYVTPSGFTISSGKGKCLADGTNLACKISTLPPGTYKIDVALPYVSVGGSAAQSCYVQITDNKGASDSPTAQAVAQAGQTDAISNVSRIFTYTSVQTDIIFTLKHTQAAGLSGSCGIYTASASRRWQMTVTPLDQPSNSALYVQGPVLSAGTGTASAAGYQGEEVSGTSTAGTGTNCAAITVNPGQWILHGMAFATLSAISGSVFYDIELDDASGGFPATTGSFVRTLYNVNGDALLSTTRIVRTSVSKTYYLNCRVAGIGGGSAVKTNSTSVLKAVRLN